VATPQTRHFPLKEHGARNLFFFHKMRIILWAAAMSGATEWRLHWGNRTKLCFFCFLLLLNILFLFLFLFYFFVVVGVYQVFVLFIYLFIVYYYLLCIFVFFIIIIFYFCSFYCFSMHNHSYLSCIYVNTNVIQTRFFIYIRVVSTLR
jgi:hypothetical protein